MENNDLNMALLDAVIDNDIEKVKSLIKQGANVNAEEDHQGATPLHFAKSTEVAKVLIKAGANVNAMDDWSITPLAIAENTEVAKVLIENGAKVFSDEFQQLKAKFGDDKDFMKFISEKLELNEHIASKQAELKEKIANKKPKRNFFAMLRRSTKSQE